MSKRLAEEKGIQGQSCWWISSKAEKRWACFASSKEGWGTEVEKVKWAVKEQASEQASCWW